MQPDGKLINKRIKKLLGLFDHPYTDTSLAATRNREMQQVVEPGEFKIMVGGSSADIRQNGSLRVVKD
ncbi:MAG TPA: hypothetical protein VIU45_03430 [Chitinophagaceae bacterium]